MLHILNPSIHSSVVNGKSHTDNHITFVSNIKKFSLIFSILCLGGVYMGCENTPSQCVEMRGDKCCWVVFNDYCVENVGEEIAFGQYPQSGTEPEPIIWNVRNMIFQGEVYDYLEDGYMYLYLVSEYVLDAKPYNDMTADGFTWKDSSIRTWLNHDFMDTAFSGNEKKYIEKTYFLNYEQYIGPENEIADYGAEVVTDDYVFLLSEYDLDQFPTRTGSDGGDVVKFDKFGKATKYAIQAGAAVEGEDCGHVNCYTSWWLRSDSLVPNVYAPRVMPPADNNSAKPVVKDTLINDRTVGIRPAMWIKVPLHP